MSVCVLGYVCECVKKIISTDNLTVRVSVRANNCTVFADVYVCLCLCVCVCVHVNLTHWPMVQRQLRQSVF